MKLKLEGKNIFYFGFLEAASRVSKYEKQKIKDEGLDITPGMLRYISLIKYHPDIMQSELISVLDITKGTLSNMLKLLIKKGYVVKNINKQDKRKQHLALTKKGNMVSALNDEIRSNIKKMLLSKISKEEYNFFVEIVLKMR